MSRVARIIVSLLIVALIALFVLYPKLGWFDDNPAPQQASGPPGGRQAMSVTGVVVFPKRLENKLVMTGEVLPNEFLELRSEMSGKVDRIYFNEGTFAKKGTLLVKINVDELDAQRQKLLYNQQLYKDIEFRQRQLLEREAISQEEYDVALTQLNTVLADISLVETQISKAEIRAPFDGIVGLRVISEGAYITPQDPITNFYSINPAKLEFAVSERYIGKVQLNSRVDFFVESIDRAFEGRVYAIEPSIDQDTRSLRIRARSDNSEGLLFPGQFARIELVLEAKDNSLMVPSEAVIPELGGTKVFLKKDGLVQPVWVETGIRGETELEIVSGISVRDTVITSGLLQIRPGMPINVEVGEEITAMKP